MNWKMSDKWRDELIASDVALVKKEARYVIEIGPSGTTVEYHNPDYGMNVIANVGPTTAFGRFYDEALLCEIGIGKSRPYREARRPREILNRIGLERDTISKTIHYRRKLFSLSAEQYRQIASRIFFLLQALTANRVNSWKKDHFFIRRKEYHFFSRKKKLIIDNGNACLAKRGCRYYVDFRDVFLAQDLYLAEARSHGIINHLGGLANITDKFLKSYRKNGFSRRFEQLKKVRQLRAILRERIDCSLPPYLLPDFLKLLPQGKRNLLYAELSQLVADILGGKTNFPQVEAAKQASRMSDPAVRFNGIDLRLISEIPAKKRKTMDGYLCVEVFDQAHQPTP